MESDSNLGSSSLSCFFCLRSTSRKYLNLQDETDSCGNSEEAVSNFYEFSLRNLYRFLNLLHSDKEEKDFKDLKMPICENCFRLNGEFNKLYNLLEETKLRLNWCVQKLQDVMIKARTEVDMGEDDDDRNILEIWRTHTFDRMNVIIDASLPRVAIYKSKKRKCPSSQFEPIQDQKTLRTEHEKQADRTTTETSEGNDDIIQSLPSASTSSSSCFGQRIGNTGMEKETGCSSLAAETDDLEIKMVCHAENVELSRESSAVDMKVENVTQDRNSTEVRSIENGNPSFILNFVPIFSRKRDSVRCKLCKQTLNRSMAFAHWKYNCRNNFQYSTTITKNKMAKSCLHPSRRPAPVPASTNTNCSYCPYVRGGGYSMDRHLARFHPEHFLLDESERDQASGFRPVRFRRTLNEIVFPKFIKNTGCQTSCSLCGIEYKCHSKSQNLSSLRQHLILKHESELKKDLNAVLEDPLLLDEKLKATNSGRVRYKNPSLCPSKTKFFSSCPYCSFKCTSSPSRRTELVTRHVVRFHPEHYLIDDGDKALGLWHEQFQIILTNLVFPNFVLSTGHHRSCPLCGLAFKGVKTFENVASVNRHLIFHHKTELKGSLKVVLDDPLLEEKLNNYSVPKAIHKHRCNAKYTSQSRCRCPYCSFKCNYSRRSHSIQGTIVSHLINFHPEHYLIDEGDKASGLWHEQLKDILTELVYPNFIGSVGRHKSCSLCGKMYKSKVFSANLLLVKRHLLFHHKVELKEKLNTILDDPLLLKKS